MGGYGSGRKYDRKSTTESQHRIDIRWLKKQGYLRPGTTGTLSWTQGDKQTGSINYRMEEDRMILIYRYRPRNGDWESVEQVILFDYTTCNYGGHRAWFLCPQCSKRVELLYNAGNYFFCRHCYNLTYASQQETEDGRYLRKAHRIRERLGASDNTLEPIMFKPKGMPKRPLTVCAERLKMPHIAA